MSALGRLIKPTLFTVGICGTCFCGAAIAQHENHRSQYQFGQLARSKSNHVFQQWTHRQTQPPSGLSRQFIEIRRKVNAWKNRLSTGEKIAYGTIFINLTVLGAWRINGLRPVMKKFFMSSVDTTKIALSPMILSCFSHSMPLHFAFNMYALYSFSPFANSLLGPEQLIGLFISAGTVSSLASITHRVLTKTHVPSLGASGALLGVIAYVCISRPDSGLLLFFIPIAAGNAIKGIIMLDTVGLLARWRFIDHAAHLGGSLFGVWYAMYGEKLFYTYRRVIVEKYVKFKKSTRYDD